MQLLPSVLNDKFEDFHADASALVRETAERIFGKRGASDSYNVSSTQAGSASRMTTNPRVKRRPCRPGCRFIPTWYSAKISVMLCLVITGDFFPTTAFEYLVSNLVSKLHVSDDCTPFQSQMKRASQTCEVNVKDMRLNQCRELFLVNRVCIIDSLI
jgi:hypothetical protein